MDTGFAIILLSALVLSGLLSLLQQRAYSKATQRMADAYKDAFGSTLVSGRGKGWGRGAVVLLVIDSLTRQVIAAEAMVGVSVLSRFRPRPKLLGSVSGLVARAGTDKKLAQALEYALQQYKVTTRKKVATVATAR
jgi:glucitol operon activator protein